MWPDHICHHHSVQEPASVESRVVVFDSEAKEKASGRICAYRTKDCLLALPYLLQRPDVVRPDSEHVGLCSLECRPAPKMKIAVKITTAHTQEVKCAQTRTLLVHCVRPGTGGCHGNK